MIPSVELENRWKHMKEQLNQSGKDAILIPLGINFQYFFGKKGEPSERIIMGVIPSENEEPFIFAPTFEKENIIRSTGLEDVVTWEETDNAYKLLNSELSSRKIGKNIGVDPKLWVIEMEKISRTGERTLSSMHEEINSIRYRKSEWEIKQLRAAAETSSKGILNARERLKKGMSEIEFAKIVGDEMSKLSSNPPVFTIVQFGENSAIPHGYPTEKKLQDNRVVLIDAGTQVNGYQGDITITTPFGKPEGFREIYDTVYHANRSALEKDREGISGANLDKIARDYIDSKGYGKYFTHRLGHGIGLEVHEEPYIVGTNEVGLLENNCHTIEPGIYIPGKFGVRIEDDVLVNKNNAELLFNTPRYNFD